MFTKLNDSLNEHVGDNKNVLTPNLSLKPRFYTKHNPRQGFTPEFGSWI